MAEFFLATKLPPQDVQRIPNTVLLIIILSKSNIAISGTKMCELRMALK